MKPWLISIASTVLLLLLVTVASAGELRTITATVGAASINSTNWSLSDNGWTFAAKTKPPLTTGMDIPVLSSGNVYLNIDSSWPADGQGLQKLFYEVVSGSSSLAPSILSPATKYVEFRFKFDEQWDIVNAGGLPTGTAIFQSWQGSGWAPFQMRTDEADGMIRGYFLMGNDDCRGSFNSNCTKVYTGSYNKGQWYTIKTEFRFGYNGNGYVKVWKDGVLQFDWTGRYGYKPASIGGQSGTPDRGSVEFGMYQQDIPGDVTKKIGFDYFKYWE